MDHGKIVSDAWNITWNNRWLWGLGFLAALTGGSGSGGGGNSFNADTFNIDPATGDMPPWLDNLANNPEALTALAGVGVTALCLLFIVSIVLYIVS